MVLFSFFVAIAYNFTNIALVLVLFGAIAWFVGFIAALFVRPTAK